VRPHLPRSAFEAFRGRRQALNVAKNALAAGTWNWTSRASLVETALEPYLAESDRIRLDVCDLRLNPDFALTLALGLNELATNAAKYGALASATGRITLTARVGPGENGVPARGQGRTELAQAGLDLPSHSADREGSEPFSFAPAL
jgi:two-component sensor histidine kinase